MQGRPVVIADAGPLIALSRITKLAILKGLFDEVWITPEIRDEVLPSRSFPGESEIADAIESGWIRIEESVGNAQPLLNPGVDSGEASALALAASRPGSLIIIDDRAGRAEAKSRGLTIIGTAAVVGLARERGLVESAEAALTAMVEAGYFIPDAVIDAIARRVDG